MSYIIKKNEPLVNLKLTDIGRRNLSEGKLTFTHFGLGDGEMDYSSDNTSFVQVLRPVDNQHGIQYPVPNELGVFITPISILTSVPTVVYSQADERGFFETGETTNVDRTLCLLTDLISESITGVTNEVIFNVTTNTIINDYKNTVGKGDYLYARIHCTNNGSGDTIPHLMFIIESVDDAVEYDISGVTTGTTLTIKLDRNLPNFSDYYIEAYIYPGRDSIKDYYDNPNPIAYWYNGSLDFTSNCTLSDDNIPVWNMNIITIEDFIGIDSFLYKNKQNAISRNYWGTAINYDYFYNNELHKVGVIHYTNNSISNLYGEGFYQNTFKLSIPYLMWHKKQFSGAGTGNSLGYTFVCGNELKRFGGNVEYYDLVDTETNQSVVGKVLPYQKIVLIENPELLSALSYKSNRNWTLPKPKLGLAEAGGCSGNSLFGAIQPKESLHVTYLFSDIDGLTGIQCEDFATITNNTTTPKDVVFEFPKDYNNPNYSEFSYLKNYDDYEGLGYRTKNILLLWQVTGENAKPSPSDWKYFNINRFIGTNGCISNLKDLCDNFELKTEWTIHNPLNPVNEIVNGIYTVAKNLSTYGSVIGDILVSINGVILKEASSESQIGIDGDYYEISANKIKISENLLISGYLFQFHYLFGETNTSSTIREDYDMTTPTTILPLSYQPNNNVVYLFYNGQLISSNNYNVIITGSTIDRRVELLFTPVAGSLVSVFYLDNSGLGGNPITTLFTAQAINNLRVVIDKNLLDLSANNVYDLGEIINLPTKNEVTDFSFGDEVFFFGNVSTKIGATIFKSLITCNVLPNRFISSSNPTFNPNQDKTAFTEIGIYDEDQDLVAIGKFSQPIQRKFNSDMLIIQATIDF